MNLKQDIYAAVAAFMAEVDKCETIDALNQSLDRPLSAVGVKHCLCISAFGMPVLQDRKLMFGFIDNKWIQHYAENHYYIDDALPNHALSLKDWGEPFWWSDFIARSELTHTQRKIFVEAHNFGLKQGLVVPIPVRVDDDDIITEYAYVSMGGSLQKSDEMENLLRLLSIAAHRTARRIYMKDDRRGRFVDDVVPISPNLDFTKLTAKEREILAWIIEGKTPSEVAMLLDVKTSTVATHIRNVKARYQFESTSEMITTLHRHKVFI